MQFLDVQASLLDTYMLPLNICSWQNAVLELTLVGYTMLHNLVL